MANLAIPPTFHPYVSLNCFLTKEDFFNGRNVLHVMVLTYMKYTYMTVKNLLYNFKVPFIPGMSPIKACFSFPLQKQNKSINNVQG